MFLLENDVRKLNVPANTVVSLTLWDIPGREDMDLHKSYFRNLDAAIGKCVLLRCHPRGQFGSKNLPKLADFSLS